jgi:hypothetical protein
MAISVADMYALRDAVKVVLPTIVQENISKLRRTAMAFKPVYRPQKRAPRPTGGENWREKVLVEYIRKVKEREDPEYSDVFSIFNKITKSSMEKLSNDIIALIQKRDDNFRLRVCTLLFDKAITNHMFASVMADCAAILQKNIPEVADDLRIQVSMFDTLYNLNDTVTNDNIIEWTRQKEKRRGYAKFVTELNIRQLISDECVEKGLFDVLTELVSLLSEAKTPQVEENIHQCAVFLFETVKLIPTTNIQSRKLVRTTITDILSSKPGSLAMKTKFKLEDALKLVG